MIMLQTNISKDVLYKLDPVLVDANKNKINDTVYGTGMDTHDPCGFLSYDDFIAYRTTRIQVHNWYRYDTFYRFAEGLFIVKFNFCDYEGRKLYLQFVDPHTQKGSFHYIEIPDSHRIHLHDYGRELFAGKSEKTKKDIQPFILKLDCDDLLLREDECQLK